MTEAIQKHRRLAEFLYDLTTQRKLNWAKSDWLNGYDAKVGDHIINLQSSAGQFAENDYYVRIISSSYEELDVFYDGDISDQETKPAIGDFTNYYLLLDSLFRTVKRQASGADSALDAILEELTRR